jgi:hypothetical protein
MTRAQPYPEHNNQRVLCNARTGSLLAYRASRARLRESDIGEGDIRETDIGERNIGERDIWEKDIRERAIQDAATTCRFNQ